MSRYRLRSADAVSNSLAVRVNEGNEFEETSESENKSEMESDTETEQSADEASDEPQHDESTGSARKRAKLAPSVRGRRKSITTGKNSYRWYINSKDHLCTRNSAITSYQPGPKEEARQAHTPLDSWSLLLTDEILEIILARTNQKIQEFCDASEIECTGMNKLLDIIELKAFIGLLYASGVQKTNNTNLEDLWSSEYGSILFRATMPKARFESIYKFLRFDDSTTREERRRNDKFAPIRQIWEKFIARCTALYTPASYCTIDEQLLSFRGRCPFKVYNGSKPDKYGIKIVMMNDSRTYYMYTALPYVGAVSKEANESVPGYYIRKLTEPIQGTTRNVTCDNWFSSIPIFDKMLDHNLTMVGTLRKNKPEIPAEFKVAGQPPSMKYVFDETKTLLSYTPKKNKVVLMLSTFHHTEGMDERSGKPEIISFYNMTKGGTDTFDQMCHEYTTARKTKRWPLRFFFGMLDQCAINATILYNFNGAHEAINRKDFLKTVIHELVRPHLERRQHIPTLRRSILLLIQQILGHVDTVRVEKPSGTLARCAYCPRNLDKKTRVRCSVCHATVCEEHRRTMCEKCQMHD